jgi:hypothetical protein
LRLSQSFQPAVRFNAHYSWMQAIAVSGGHNDLHITRNS